MKTCMVHSTALNTKSHTWSAFAEYGMRDGVLREMVEINAGRKIGAQISVRGSEGVEKNRHWIG